MVVTRACGSFGSHCRVTIVASWFTPTILVYTDYFGLHRLFWFTPTIMKRMLPSSNFFQAWQQRPCNKGSGQTSIVQGLNNLNNKWRTRVSGLVRKTVCVQPEEDLERRLLLVREQHNQQCRERLEKLAWLALSIP